MRLLHYPRMRTLPEAAKELREQDPQTRLTLPVLRRLTKEGVIPCVYTGRRALLDMNELNKHLYGTAAAKESSGKIRKID